MKVLSVGLSAELLLMLLYLQQPEQAPVNPAPPSVFGTMDGTVQMQIVILVTTIAGFLYNIYMHRSKVAEDRRKDALRIDEAKMQREWDVEDRKRARDEATRRIEEVHQQVTEAKQVAAVTAQKVDDRAAHLEQKLDQNTELSRQAFSEANNFNAKNLHLNELINDALKRFEASEASIEVSKTTVRAVPTEGKSDAGPPETSSSDSK